MARPLPAFLIIRCGDILKNRCKILYLYHSDGLCIEENKPICWIQVNDNNDTLLRLAVTYPPHNLAKERLVRNCTNTRVAHCKNTRCLCHSHRPFAGSRPHPAFAIILCSEVYHSLRAMATRKLLHDRTRRILCKAIHRIAQQI
jgi:hypothetical protein